MYGPAVLVLVRGRARINMVQHQSSCCVPAQLMTAARHSQHAAAGHCATAGLGGAT
jgi:hypothetical protein